MKKALVLGAGGFIGSHLVKRLKREGYYVKGADLKYPDFTPTAADEFIIADLSDQVQCKNAMKGDFDEIYQLAADMGGAGYIFTGENDAAVMHNSATINLNVLDCICQSGNKPIIFYSSSACIYPEHNQLDPDNPNCEESSAYPAAPDSEYGWEKLFSERLYLAYQRNFGIPVRVGRFHNIYGPEGTWQGGKEKSPAALCRKIAAARHDGEIEIWGDGKQTRSFLYIDDCLDAVRLMMQNNFAGPLNIGSEEMISINDFAGMINVIAKKNVVIKNIPGPLGVRGRRSDNKLIEEKLGWKPGYDLNAGIMLTFQWIEGQMKTQSKI